MRISPDEECSTILEKYVELMEKLRPYITRLCSAKPINITGVSTKYHGKPEVYAFFNYEECVYVGSARDL